MSKNLPSPEDSGKIRSVFISYSWDSYAHKEWILQLATELQQNGVKTLIDQWDVRPGMNLQQYMEYSVRTSDFVLMICTPKYAEKANQGKGGVGYEKSIITGEIFHATGSDLKFVPLLREGDPTVSLPSFLSSRVFIDFRKAEYFEDSLEDLLRHLFDAPRYRRPPLGPAPAFAASTAPQLVTVLSEEQNPMTLVIAIGKREYRLDLPDWLNSIRVNLPDEIENDAEIRNFVAQNFGADTGTEKTWKSAWKAWLLYIQRTGEIPIYLAHCYKAGGDYKSAARLYAELFEFHGDTEMSEWYATFLAYNAGVAYQAAGQSGLAALWFAKAAKNTTSANKAVSYYARTSQEYFARIQRKTLNG